MLGFSIDVQDILVIRMSVGGKRMRKGTGSWCVCCVVGLAF